MPGAVNTELVRCLAGGATVLAVDVHAAVQALGLTRAVMARARIKAVHGVLAA